MSANYIMALMQIGTLSLDLRAAELAADSAKRDYHSAWRQFELGEEVTDPDQEIRYVAPDERIRQGHGLWLAAQDATKRQFEVYKAAKRTAYNAKRRWQNACRSAK